MKKTKLILALCLTTCMGFAQNFTQVINVLGNGVPGTTVNGTAINTSISNAAGVVVDHSGNIYMADAANNVILKVNTFGVVTRIAGTSGSSGYAGDGGPASGALFNYPSYICLDASNNLYICDVNNNVVRKITAQNGTLSLNCTINTVAGSGGYCNQGSGSQNCGDAMLATSVDLTHPSGIVVDNNYNLFISSGPTLKEVFNALTVINGTTYQAGYIYTIAGTDHTNGSAVTNIPASSALFDGLGQLAFDASYTNLYMVDGNNSVIRKINMTNRYIYNFAGGGNCGTSFYCGDGGPATSAKISFPTGVVVDANNNVFIADQNNFRIRMVNAAAIISTIAGTGNTNGACNYLAPTGNNNSNTGAKVNPGQLALDACGSLYFCDINYYVVGKLPNGLVPAYSPSISSPSPICSGAGNIVATCATGSTVPPDSYSWSILSCDASGHSDGIYSSGPFTIDNTMANSTTGNYTFPYTPNMPCNHNYVIQMTVRKNCPSLTIATAYSQVYINCSPAPVITGNTTVCSVAGSTTLCENIPAGAPNTITWYTHGKGGNTYLGSGPCLTESPTSNTTYNVTVLNTATGCSGTASQLVTIQNIQPNFSITATSGVGGTSAPYYTIEAFNQTTSSDYSFEYWWGIKEVTGTGPFTTVPNTEVDNPTSQCFWTGSNPCWFAGYQATNIPQYTSGTNPALTCSTAFGSGAPYQGYFLKGHQYQVTYGTWSNTCAWKSASSVAYICSGCREQEGHAAIFPSNLTFEDAMGVKNQSNVSLTEASNVSIYPNPSSGNFTVETVETTPQVIQVFDLTGRMVISETITGTTNINAANLANGIYNVKIISGQSAINKKIIITK